jgi:hypothetical protein
MHTLNEEMMIGYDFIDACAMGKMDKAKKFLRSGSVTKSDMEFGFRQACYSGHLEIAKWVLGVNPDIEKLDEELQFILHNACEYEQLDVIIWLMNIKKDIKISEIDTQIIRQLLSKKCE